MASPTRLQDVLFAAPASTDRSPQAPAGADPGELIQMKPVDDTPYSQLRPPVSPLSGRARPNGNRDRRTQSRTPRCTNHSLLMPAPFARCCHSYPSSATPSVLATAWGS